MSQDQTDDLLKFLRPFDPVIIKKIMWLRDFAWKLCPKANELIYDNYNAVAFGWSHTERVSHTICSIAVGRSSNNVHFGFYWGKEIADPKNMLLGEGNQYRYLLVTDEKTFPQAYVKKLVKDAYHNALAKVKDPTEIVHGKTIVKSVSQAKRPGRKAAKKTIKKKTK